MKYKFNVATAIFAIILFFILYLSLIISLCLLIYLAFIFPVPGTDDLSVFIKGGALAGSIILLLFSIKFLFKIKKPTITDRVKIDLEKNPRLKQLIIETCNQTRATYPEAVYLDPGISAYVKYTNPWRSLILPTKKELTIGLGLIHVLTISELKAVIAHEFGHFSQKSMKIGSYIMTADTIVHDMIFKKDKWDLFLEKWKNIEFKIAILARITISIVWLMKQILKSFYFLLNRAYFSLSREMEYNADKVAVRVTGSQALFSSIWKLNFASDSWNRVLININIASKHKIWSKDFYNHFENDLRRNSEKQNRKFNELPVDQNGNKIFFHTTELSRVPMYATHPPNNLREQNGKSPFVNYVTNNKEALSLIENPKELQETLSAIIYSEYLLTKPDSYSELKDVEDFILTEEKDKILASEFLNTFENRFITIPEIDEINNFLNENNCEQFKFEAVILELKSIMKPVIEINEKINKAISIQNGTSISRSIYIDRTDYLKKDIHKAISYLEKKRDALFYNPEFVNWDKSFIFSTLCLTNNEKDKEELLNRIIQLRVTINFFKQLAQTKFEVFTLANRILVPNAEEENIEAFSMLVKEKVIALNQLLLKIKEAPFVALPNINSIDEFLSAIIENGTFYEFKGSLMYEGRFGVVFKNLENAFINCKRIEEKAINAFLRKNYELRQIAHSE